MSTTNTASDAATSAAAAAPSTGPPHADAHSNRVDVINTAGGRILCIADIRGENASQIDALSQCPRYVHGRERPVHTIIE